MTLEEARHWFESSVTVWQMAGVVALLVALRVGYIFWSERK